MVYVICVEVGRYRFKRLMVANNSRRQQGRHDRDRPQSHMASKHRKLQDELPSLGMKD